MSPGASCPTGCSLETAVKVGNGTTGGFVCEANCVQESEGAGAENEDLHIFVTIQDSTALWPSLACFLSPFVRAILSQKHPS